MERVWNDHVRVVRMDSTTSVSGDPVPYLLAIGSQGDSLAISGEGCPERAQYSSPPRLAVGQTHSLRLRSALPVETGLYRVTDLGVVLDEDHDGEPLYFRGEPFSSSKDGMSFVVIDGKCR